MLLLIIVDSPFAACLCGCCMPKKFVAIPALHKVHAQQALYASQGLTPEGLVNDKT